MKPALKTVFYLILTVDLFILTFVSGILYQEKMLRVNYPQFDTGDITVISRGYYKGCKGRIESYDSQFDEYLVRVTGCLTRKHKPKDSEVFSSHELNHLISEVQPIANKVPQQN